MDDRLQSALEFSNFRLNLFNIKENIKVKVDSMLTTAMNGGVFKIDRELICFVKMVLDAGKDSVVLIDDNQNPIEITNIQTFYDDILSRYFEATNFYNVEYTKLKRSRSTAEQFDNFTLGE
jgi:flagellum-specific peptidoglycan hydrolase FlgJ